MAAAKGHIIPNAPRGRTGPNKLTKHAKEAFQLAFEGIGGVDALIDWARKEDNQGAFYALFARLIPAELKHSGSDEPGAKAVLIHFTRQDQPK